MNIRPITPADDRMAISKIYEESWKYAYQGILPQAYLDSIPSGQWISRLNAPNRTILLGLEQKQMIGTVSYSKSRLEQFPDWGEIISIYLLPAYIGKGYGKALMEAAISELHRQGYANLFLWVLEENYRAKRFYEKLGFRPTCHIADITIGGKQLQEVRYVLTEQEC